MLDKYEWAVRRALRASGSHGGGSGGAVRGQPGHLPLSGPGLLPRTDAGQFTINLKVPTGTRIEVTNEYVAKVENLIRKHRDPEDFKMVVSNIGVVPDFSVALHHQRRPLHRHRAGGAARMSIAQQLRVHGPGAGGDGGQKYPEIRTFFSSGSMVDAILNIGMPAPIDVQVSSSQFAAGLRHRAGSGAQDSATCRAWGKFTFPRI